MRLFGLLPFLLQVHAQTPRCLIIEDAANGWKSLTSPDYPKKFSPHTQCIYRLTAPQGERIEIEFVDFLLFNNDAEECAEQGLSIRDPEIETLIGKYCGNTKPPNYTTMGNALFLYLSSNTDGEYKGFHIKYRVYGSSPHMASEVAIPESKSAKVPKGPKTKPKPVKAGGMGAKILAAMSAKKIQLKSSEEKGDFDTNHLTASIDMQASPHRRRRQAYGRQPAPWGNTDYAAYGSGPPARRGPPAGNTRGAGAGGNRYTSAADNTVQSRGSTAPKCRPGYPCNPDGTGIAASAPSAPTERKISCIGNGCKNKASSSKRYLTYLIWFIVIAVFGGIGWYIYQTYFAEDEEKKKKEEEDEKKKEAEGNIGAATLARGLSGPTKIPGFDAPPRYESWQDHAQPISVAQHK